MIYYGLQNYYQNHRRYIKYCDSLWYHTISGQHTNNLSLDIWNSDSWTNVNTQFNGIFFNMIFRAPYASEQNVESLYNRFTIYTALLHNKSLSKLQMQYGLAWMAAGDFITLAVHNWERQPINNVIKFWPIFFTIVTCHQKPQANMTPLLFDTQKKRIHKQKCKQRYNYSHIFTYFQQIVFQTLSIYCLQMDPHPHQFSLQRMVLPGRPIYASYQVCKHDKKSHK